MSHKERIAAFIGIAVGSIGAVLLNLTGPSWLLGMLTGVVFGKLLWGSKK